MNKKLFLTITICLLMLSTALVISRPITHDVHDITNDFRRVGKSREQWSSYNGWWVMCNSNDTLQLTSEYEVLQYPHYNAIYVLDIIVSFEDDLYTWNDAVHRNIVDRHICIYTGGSNFPEPVEKLDPFKYYIFSVYEECVLLFEGID